MALVTLSTLVERLQGLAPHDVCIDRVQDLLADGELDEGELRPLIGALPNKYARRPVFRSPLFDVMVLSWAPGQFTPVHNHAGNCGWVRLVRGQIQEEMFRLVPGAAVPDAAVAPSVHGRVGCVGLEATSKGVIADVGAVASVDRERAIHRLGNPAGAGGDLTVTLHVYSRPHDVCLAFDPESRTCERRELRFDPMLA